jgi:hypothetical protein
VIILGKNDVALEATYTKEQIFESGIYGDHAALLADGVLYTKKEVEDLIENYMKGEVK